jgi:hypothetical protein
VVRHTGRMGTVLSSSFENRQVDGLVMNGGSWLPYVWTAGTGGDGIAHVLAARTPVLRDAVCSNGSFTGQNCAGQVRAVNSCVQVREDADTVIRACGMASAASTNGTRMVQAGDSGGPVYRRVTGGVEAEGVISAMSDDHMTVFFAEINDFTKKFSVTVAR